MICWRMVKDHNVSYYYSTAFEIQWIEQIKEQREPEYWYFTGDMRDIMKRFWYDLSYHYRLGNPSLKQVDNLLFNSIDDIWHTEALKNTGSNHHYGNRYR